MKRASLRKTLLLSVAFFILLPIISFAENEDQFLEKRGPDIIFRMTDDGHLLYKGTWSYKQKRYIVSDISDDDIPEVLDFIFSFPPDISENLMRNFIKDYQLRITPQIH